MANNTDMQKQGKANAANASNTAGGQMPIIDIIYMTLHHWPWIILSVALCVGAAYIYLLRTPDVYTRAAEIMIKDDAKSGTSAGSTSDFSALGLFQSNTNIQNEMINLRAQDLMEEVVRRMRLDIDYYKDGRFHDRIAYGLELPVKVLMPDFPEDSSVKFRLTVNPEGVATITDIKSPLVPDANPSETYSGQLGDTIRTVAGPFVVQPTSHYIDGSDIKLTVNKYPLSAARNSYKGRLGVTISNEKASVVRLTMADQSIQRADDVLSTLINVYNENWIRDKNQIAVSTSNFINERLGVIEGELGNVDSDISSYKSQHLIPNVDAAASMYMSQNQQNEAAMFEVSNQLAMARYVRSYLVADGNRDQLLPANSGLANSSITSLIGEYNDKLLTRNSLLAKSSEKNPLVQQLDEQLAAQRQAIVHTIDNEIIALNTQMNALRSNEARTVAKLQSNPTQAKNLLSVERQQKVKESLYLFLLQKREENELSQAFSAYNTRIVNRPGSAGIPSTPARGRILAIAFLLGLAIPFGVTYARESLNTKVRGRKDVENLTLPFLGEIPQYGGPRKRKNADTVTPPSDPTATAESKALVVKAGKRDVINEAFRVLRTNLEFMKLNKEGADIVAITSFNPGSGKSFLTMNLAVTLALKEKRVLVIDGDMRHGSSSAYIGSPSIGLSDILNGTIPGSQPDGAIVTSPDHPTLQVLPIGTVPPNPTELLESPRFATLLDSLRPHYDYILFDCPPIEVVADAQIIDRYADRTIFVLRAGLLERTMLAQLERIYDEKKFKNMAFILNGTRNDQGRYGYSHSYRYGYGYGYGYGYNYGGKQPSRRKSTKLGGANG